MKINIRFLTILLVSICSTAIANNIITPTCTSPEFNAVKWYRQSAERNAMYREIFLLAENVIKHKIEKEKLKPHQWGIILDIDETVLDNSAWNLQHLHGNKQDWSDFAAQSLSVSEPGAKQFLDDIHKMGGNINLISNRRGRLLAATEKNLHTAGIYYDQVILDNTNVGTSFVDKNPRFAAIITGSAPSKLPAQKIIGWFGDNIQDFPKLMQAEQIQKNPDSDEYKAFGDTYFVLPNPMYGSWDKNKFE